MKKDYLWDRSGEPDPEIEKLERVLMAYRHKPVEPVFPDTVPDYSPAHARECWLRRIAANVVRHPSYAVFSFASLLLIIVGAWKYFHRTPYYQIVNLEGAPTVGATRVKSTGRLGVGQWLETDGESRARILVGDIGQVEIEPNTRIRLDKSRPTEHRMSLDRGLMHALIWAPPRLFFVNTPSAQAVDLGCAYTLSVDDDGTGLLKVSMGWVAFEHQGHESFVPAGAECRTRRNGGPGTPYLSDATPAFRDALERCDFGTTGDETGHAPLLTVLSEARKTDAFTLWHMLARADASECNAVFDRLAQLVPPPPGVTRDGILQRNRSMLDLWWDELGLGDTRWWRLWKGPFPQDK